MTKKMYMMTVAIGGVMFAAGFLTRMAVDAGGPKDSPVEEQKPKETAAEQREEINPEEMGYVASDTIRVRIEDNQVQWYDGRLWHEVASVEELEKEDRFCLAEEAFREFDEQMRQEKAAARQEQAGETEASGTLSVGVKETPRPVQRPQATPAPQVPADVPAPEAGPADNGGSGGNSGGGAPQPENPGGGAPQPANPATPPPVTPPPADVPADSGNSGDTGDGENMEWSDDYL